MFLDHSELWMWRAVQGWKCKSRGRTLAWHTEGPRFYTAKGKENRTDFKHQCVRWVRESQKSVKCRGDLIQCQSREGSPGPSISYSPLVSSTWLPHWWPQKLPQVPSRKNKGSATTRITVTWVYLKEDRRKSWCWLDDPEALWHLLQKSCTAGDREANTGE